METEEKAPVPTQKPLNRRHFGVGILASTVSTLIGKFGFSGSPETIPDSGAKKIMVPPTPTFVPTPQAARAEGLPESTDKLTGEKVNAIERHSKLARELIPKEIERGRRLFIFGENHDPEFMRANYNAYIQMLETAVQTVDREKVTLAVELDYRYKDFLENTYDTNRPYIETKSALEKYEQERDMNPGGLGYSFDHFHEIINWAREQGVNVELIDDQSELDKIDLKEMADYLEGGKATPGIIEAYRQRGEFFSRSLRRLLDTTDHIIIAAVGAAHAAMRSIHLGSHVREALPFVIYPTIISEPENAFIKPVTAPRIGLPAMSRLNDYFGRTSFNHAIEQSSFKHPKSDDGVKQGLYIFAPIQGSPFERDSAATPVGEARDRADYQAVGDERFELGQFWGVVFNVGREKYDPLAALRERRSRQRQAPSSESTSQAAGQTTPASDSETPTLTRDLSEQPRPRRRNQVKIE